MTRLSDDVKIAYCRHDEKTKHTLVSRTRYGFFENRIDDVAEQFCTFNFAKFEQKIGSKSIPI